jgi:hypothetical protein
MAAPQTGLAIKYASLKIPDGKLDVYSYCRLWGDLASLQIYGISIVPLAAYKIGSDPKSVGIPGIGQLRNEQISTAILLLLKSDTGFGLTNDHQINAILERVSATSGCGYKALIDIGTKVAKALDLTETIQPPIFDGDVFALASKYEAFFILDAMRGVPRDVKTRAITFLKAIPFDTTSYQWVISGSPQESREDWELVSIAEMVDNGINAGENNPPRYPGVRMIQPQYEEITSTGVSQSNEANMIQGCMEMIQGPEYCSPCSPGVNTTRSGRSYSKNTVDTSRKGFPTNYKGRKIPAYSNKGRKCEVCLRLNHTANHCDFLAQAAFAWLVINDKKNKHNMKILEEAMKNYSDRWARIQAKYAPDKPSINLVQVLD